MASPKGKKKTDLILQGERASDDKNSIKFAGLDPILGSLGQMIGLLKKDESAADTYFLIPEWFTNPYKISQEGIKKNIADFGKLLGQLLGDVGGNALGVPEKDPAILGTWYPIQVKDTSTKMDEPTKPGEATQKYKPTGLYIVSIENKDKDGNLISTAIGLGVLKKWSVIKGIQADVWASIPVLVINAGGTFELTFTDENNINPITLGIAVEGDDPSKPIINENHITFNGVKFSGNIFLSPPTPRFDLSLEILSLQLADDDAPRNYSLADLKAITPLEILDTAVNLFLGALSKEFSTKAAELAYFAPLFGFSKRVPKSSVELPLLEWVQLFEFAAKIKKGDISTPFFNWFNSLASDPNLLKAWMSCVSGFLGIDMTQFKVSGHGNRSQPFLAPIIKIPKVGQVSLTTASEVIADGTRFFYPGFAFTSEQLPIAKSETVFMIEADLELAQFQLSGAKSNGTGADLLLNFIANFNLQGKDGTKLLDGFQGISLEKFSGGLALSALTGKVVPHLELINLVLPPQQGQDGILPDGTIIPAVENTAPNEFGVVNLLSPDQLAKVGAVALSGELQKLILGDQGTPSNTTEFRHGIAVLLGLIKPKNVPEDWQMPPFSETGIPESIKDPIHAWAQYYLNIIESKDVVAGVRPFTYILQSLAELLHAGTVAVKVEGGGTPTDPWMVGISVGDVDMPAHIVAFEDTSGEDVQLVFGMNIAPELTIPTVNIKIIPSLAVNALRISFPKGKPVAAKWFDKVFASLQLPDKIATPKIGDAIFSVDCAQLSAGWQQNIGWDWSILVDKPTLTIGKSVIVGDSLNFSEQTTWKELVSSGAKDFGKFFAGALGVGMMRTETRAGLLTAASLGLLTDFSSYPIFQNSGLTWDGFAGIDIKDFSDPLSLVRGQLASNLNTVDKSKSFLSMIAWTLSKDAKAPAIKGGGSFLDPFQMPLPKGFDMPIWYDIATEIIGLGLAKNLSFDYGDADTGIHVEASTRVNTLEYDLKNATLDTSNIPSFVLEILISSQKSGGHLIDLPDGSGYLGQLAIGFEIGMKDGQLNFQPIVTLLNTKLTKKDRAASITLSEFKAKELQFQTAFLGLLNSGLNKTIDLVKTKPIFQKAYTILSALGLTTVSKTLLTDAVTVDSASLGINTGGWSALISDPIKFIEKQLLNYLKSSEAGNQLRALFKQLTGITIPTLPLPALELFSGLGLVGSASDNYPLLPETLLQLFSNPVNTIKTQFENLFDNEENRKALAKALTKNISPVPFGPFELTSNAAGVISLIIPDKLANSFNIGTVSGPNGTTLPFLAISGSLDLSFANDNISVSVHSKIPSLELTLASVFTVAYKDEKVNVPVPALSLIWGDGKKPSAPPLQILPITKGKTAAQFYLDQFEELAPAYVLELFLKVAFEYKLLDKFPVVQHIFSILGIAEPKAAMSSKEAKLVAVDNLSFKMPSILGLLLHPLDWLLSDEVLGTKGKFDIAKLVKLLAEIPEKSYQPKNPSSPAITIGPNKDKNGLSITGLPYQFYIDMSGVVTPGDAKDLATFSFGVKTIEVAKGKGSLNDLKFAVMVANDFQASFGGGVKLATTKVGGLSIDVGYDNGFKLALGQGTQQAPGPSIQFLPFAGWGTLAGQAGAFAAVEVVDQVVPMLLKKLKTTKAAPFAEAMETFGEKVNAAELIKKLAAVISANVNPNGSHKVSVKASDIGHELEVAALDWLKGLFNAEPQLDNTIAGIQALFAAIPKGIGTVIVLEVDNKVTHKKEKSLLQFTPGKKLPFSIFFGVDENNNLGIWVGLEVPDIKYLKIDVLPTGVGVDVDTLSKLTFSFGADVILPLGGDNGPGLKLTHTDKEVFKLELDLLAYAGTDPDKIGVSSDVAIELLPTFFANKQGEEPADLGDAVEAWMLKVIKFVLPRYVSILVLGNTKVKSWLEYNLFELIKNKVPGFDFKLTAIELLMATDLVIESPEGSKKYALNSIDAILKIKILEALSNLLKTLLKDEVRVFSFDGGKAGIYIGPRKGAAFKDTFGLRLDAPDFKIGKASNFILQLGAADTEWITNTVAKDSPELDLEPGVQFYFPIVLDNGIITAQFEEFNIVLGNVGFDVVGKNGQPLVNTARFKLGGVEPRVLLDIQFHKGAPPDITFGGNLTLADMAISLAPNQLTTPTGGDTSKANPIAKNLLGSGSEAEEPDKKNPPTNPTFSVQAAYTQDFKNNEGELWVNLASTTSEGKEVVIPVQRAFGPLFIADFGIGWDDDNKEKPKLDILFSGNVDLAGLKIDLIGLDIGVPVKTLTDLGSYTLDLKGLDVSYKGGSVTINAGLLEQKLPNGIQYGGAAVIKASQLSVIAMGAYAQINTPVDPQKPEGEKKKITSLFVFGAIDIPLGGPPAFFITGLAAGFGYNRSLRIPAVEDVMNFPLITGVLNGTLTSSTDPKDALTSLLDWVKPEVGEYWLAAGLKFKSFELINTAALLFIKFGKEFEIDILGLSYAALPPGMTADNALVYFELALKVAIKPTDGVISVEAQLTPNSFVLTKECKVTGGFAFYLWFKNTSQLINGVHVPINKGQFVITLGGYHPKFKPPPFYPIVPRLGLLWKMNFAVGSLSIGGGVYFAICPTAVMAGGYLDAKFNAGPLKAWLDAYANFLIEWKPFYFDIGIGITVGVSFGFTVSGVDITISAELSAKLNLQGPPVNGVVEVSWYVISFSIPFGDKKTETTDNNLKTWGEFATNFLPKPPQASGSKKADKKRHTTPAEIVNTAAGKQQILKWNIGAGRQTNNNAQKKGAAEEPWKVSTMFYRISLGSVIPTSILKVSLPEGAPVSDMIQQTMIPVGVRPMGPNHELASPVTIELKDNSGKLINITARNLSHQFIFDGAPLALWGKEQLKKGQVPDGNKMIRAHALTGVEIIADKHLYQGNILPFPISNLTYSQGDIRLNPLAIRPTQYAAPAGPLSQKNQFTQIMNSIMSVPPQKDIVGTRNAIYTALAGIQPYAAALPNDTDEVNGKKLNALQKSIVKTGAVVSMKAPLSPDLSIMSSSADLIFQVFPVIAEIGTYQNSGKINGPKLTPAITTAVVSEGVDIDKTVLVPVLEGSLKRHMSRRKVRRSASLLALPTVNSYWTEADQVTSKTVGRSVIPGDNEQAKSLIEGSAYTWRLDEKSKHNIKRTGNLEAIAYCFNEFDGLIDAFLIPTKKTVIPSSTVKFTTSAFDPNHTDIIGWQTNSQVVKINSLWSMGDGYMVRTQHGHRDIIGQRRYGGGKTDIAQILDQNLALLGEELSQGWIQTLLYSDKPNVAILVDSDDPQALNIAIGMNELPGRIGQQLPIHIIAFGDKYLHVFKVNDIAKTTHQYTGVMLQANEDYKVSGVYSWNDKQLENYEIAGDLQLMCCGLDPMEQEIKSSELVLTY